MTAEQNEFAINGHAFMSAIGAKFRAGAEASVIQRMLRNGGLGMVMTPSGEFYTFFHLNTGVELPRDNTLGVAYIVDHVNSWLQDTETEDNPLGNLPKDLIHYRKLSDILNRTLKPADWDRLLERASLASPDGEHIITHPRDSNNWEANDKWCEIASPETVMYLFQALQTTVHHLDTMCQLWRTISDTKGWDPGHMQQYEDAQRVLADLEQFPKKGRS